MSFKRRDVAFGGVAFGGVAVEGVATRIGLYGRASFLCVGLAERKAESRLENMCIKRDGLLVLYDDLEVLTT